MHFLKKYSASYDTAHITHHTYRPWGLRIFYTFLDPNQHGLQYISPNEHKYIATPKEASTINNINCRQRSFIFYFLFFFFCATAPMGQGLLIHEVSRSHTTTHHSLQDSSERVISSSQRPLPDNTQQSRQTDIHAPGGIRTHNLSRGAAADPHHRPFSQYIHSFI